MRLVTNGVDIRLWLSKIRNHAIDQALGLGCEIVRSLHLIVGDILAVKSQVQL
jgi:hypothetical protein